jgi:hypothetical protein
MRRDAWTPELCSQRSTAETSVARQRLAKTRFPGNEYACINQSIVRRLTHVFVATDETENNRKISCSIWWSILGLHEVNSVQDPDPEFERLETLQDSFDRHRSSQFNSWSVLRIRFITKQRLSKQIWRLYFMGYNYSNLQSVIIICS